MAKILVVGPHPDDQEAGMGATIAKLVSQGHDVLLLDMTNGEPTPLGDPATREQEAARAAEILGVRRRMLRVEGPARGFGGDAAWGWAPGSMARPRCLVSKHRLPHFETCTASPSRP